MHGEVHHGRVVWEAVGEKGGDVESHDETVTIIDDAKVDVCLASLLV